MWQLNNAFHLKICLRCITIWIHANNVVVVWQKSLRHEQVLSDVSQVVVATLSNSKWNNEVGDTTRSKVTPNALHYENGIVGIDMHPIPWDLLYPSMSTPVILGCAPFYKENEKISSYNKSILLILSMQ